MEILVSFVSKFNYFFFCPLSQNLIELLIIDPLSCLIELQCASERRKLEGYKISIKRDLSNILLFVEVSKNYRREQFSRSLTFRVISAAAITLSVTLISYAIRWILSIVTDFHFVLALSAKMTRGKIFRDRETCYFRGPISIGILSNYFFRWTDRMFIGYRSHNCDWTFNCV